MKKIIFTLVICIGFLSARAGYLPSDLTIRMWDHSVISLVFDSEVYDQYNSSYTLNGITGGKHLLKVYRYNSTPHGQLSAYPKMVFSSYIHIKPGKSINAMINSNSRFVVLSEISLAPAGNHYGNNHPGNNHPGNGHPGGNYYEPYYNNYNTFSGMSHFEFTELKSIVNNTSFDDNRLTICKQAISSNYVSSNQVFELMNLLTFESNKLELAKFAYPHTTDKNKYYLVNNAFSFSSSISELNEFIYGH